MKHRFAFVIHPHNYQYLERINSFIRFLKLIFPEYVLKEFCSKLPPYKYLEINSIKSLTGEQTSGIIIILPLLPDQIVLLKHEYVHHKLSQVLKIAENSGAEILGLGGFTSIISNQGMELIDKTKMHLTTGNTLTAAAAIKSIEENTKNFKTSFRDISISILGSTGDIGSVCSEYFCNKVRTINLMARDQLKLIEQKERLSVFATSKINISTQMSDDIYRSEVIISCVSSLAPLIDPNNIKPGVVFCDVSIPASWATIDSIDKNSFIYQGGFVLLPKSQEINNSLFWSHFPTRAVFGCLAETILLSLSNSFEMCSLGRGNITIEKLEKLWTLALKHGFSLAPMCIKNF